MSLSTALDDLSSGLGEAPPEQEAGTLPAWSIVPNRPMQNSSPSDAKSSAARNKTFSVARKYISKALKYISKPLKYISKPWK